MEPANIAVSGGRGFVGKALVTALSGLPGEPYRVLSIIRGRAHNRSGALQEIGFENDDLPHRLEGVKAFIHAAGKSKGKPEALLEDNVVALQRYIDMLPASLEQIIHFSSVNVLFPRLSPYGETKLKSEQLWASSSFADRVTVLRPALIYGPGDRANIGRLIRLVDCFPVIPVPAGGSLRPVFLQDVVDLVVELASRGSSAGRTMVVSGCEQIRLKNLVLRLAHQIGCRRVCLALPDWLLASLSQTGRFCGIRGVSQTIDSFRLDRPWHDPAVWQVLRRPVTCLDEGLRQCVDDYKKNMPSCQS